MTRFINLVTWKGLDLNIAETDPLKVHIHIISEIWKFQTWHTSKDLDTQKWLKKRLHMLNTFAWNIDK